jgi:superfamily II DNA or RNA helicase
MDDPGLDREIARIRDRLTRLDAEKAQLLAALEALGRHRLEPRPPAPPRVAVATAPEIVTASSPADQKIGLFRRRFAGRSDVFPVRWENTRTKRSGYAPACANEWVRGVCGKPHVKCGECPNQAFLPVSNVVIAQHLGGDRAARGKDGRRVVMGVYALLADETCWFLAVDFDGAAWADDARAFMETCGAEDVPAALERSRSGDGGHVWIFFAAPVPARDARRLGSWLVTRTMERRPEIGFASYDRFFPSQDTMPLGGFGNLIALPLQWEARARGNSVFVDNQLRPYADQWAYLASVPTMAPAAIPARMLAAESAGGLFGGVRLPVEDENAEEPWLSPPSRRRAEPPVSGPLPASVRVVLGDQVYVDRSALPPSMTARLVRLAAFQNPEFYRAQAMRLPAFGKPRIISCAELTPRHVGLPRGCLDEAISLLKAHGVSVELEDHRHAGSPLPADVRFLGDLQAVQKEALEALGPHDLGVLAATTAFGKTVVAAALIARRQRNTLVLVHRRELMDQWVARLATFLSIDPAKIGMIGGGRRKPTGVIDVALIQSLVRKGEVSDLVGFYGHLVVDECHHLSAVSFELAARRAKARHVLGLSATVARKDGHHPIIFMQCGPVRYRVDARAQAARRGIEHHVRLRPTEFRLPPSLSGEEQPSMPAIYAALAQDGARNEIIFDDVLSALEAKRSPVVLTERRDHLQYLRERFQRFTPNLVVLHGGMTAAARSAAKVTLSLPDHEERLILATGRYLGEGFDDARLDTLFLTMPISWKGTLAQYVGRLHREHQGKKEVLVYDYTDSAVPVLARMAARRGTGYRALGYVITTG